MRDFILYHQPKQPIDLEKKEYTTEDFKRVSSTSRIPELELVKEGRLEFIRQSMSLNLFHFSCEFQLPRPLAATSVGYAKMGLELWQQRQGIFMASFNAPKRLSKIAVAMLSQLMYGDPFYIRPYSLTRNDFLKLRELIMEKKGDLKQLIFGGIKNEKGQEANITQFRLSGSKLDKMEGFNDLLEHSAKIKCLGFSVKPTLESREISFRIIDWGGGQFYHPTDPLDHEILEFLQLFNNSFRD